MSDRRLPLPGESPRTVWRPDRRRRRARSPLVRIGLGLGGLIVLGVGLWAWQVTALPVTVAINGEPVELRVHRATAGGAARAAGVPPDEMAYIAPPADTPLEAGMLVVVGQLRPVIVHADGQTFLARTRSTDPNVILAELGITLNPSDAARIERAARPSAEQIAAYPELAAVPAIPREISVIRARMVIVNEGGTQVSFVTSETSLGAALAGAGYTFYEADDIQPPPHTLIPPEGLTVTISRAAPLTVIDGGQAIAIRTHQPTVADVLAELGLAPVGDDYVLPGLSDPTPAGGTIRVVRVREETALEEVPIPFETVYVPDPEMELDQLREVQPGREGALARETRIRTEDGVEVSRVMASEWTARQPQARVVAYGTRIVIRTLETADGPIRYWRTLHVLATSYSPSTAGDKQPGDPRFGLSGTGGPVLRGVIATDPRVIPLYTRMYVPGYGFGQALDVGGAIKGLRIDLGYDDASLVLWNNWVDIYLVLPVPPPDQMVWVLPGE